MRLLTASLRPCDLGESAAALSILSGFVPAVRIDLVVVSEQRNDDIMALFKPVRERDKRARTGSSFRPIGRAVRIRDRETEEAADRT
jgi:hypothetical protein